MPKMPENETKEETAESREEKKEQAQKCILLFKNSLLSTEGKTEGCWGKAYWKRKNRKIHQDEKSS